MKRSLIALALCAGIAFGSSIDSKDDLLGTATAGKVNGSAFELSSKEMKDVVGGSYSWYQNYSSPYKYSAGYITEGVYGYSAKMFAKPDGTIWVTYVASGVTYQLPLGSTLNNLISLYGSRAVYCAQRTSC